MSTCYDAREDRPKQTLTRGASNSIRGCQCGSVRPSLASPWLHSGSPGGSSSGTERPASLVAGERDDGRLGAASRRAFSSRLPRHEEPTIRWPVRRQARLQRGLQGCAVCGRAGPRRHTCPWLERLRHDELRALLARIAQEPMSTKKPLSAAACARHTSNTGRQSWPMAWAMRWEGALGATARCWAAGLAH